MIFISFLNLRTLLGGYNSFAQAAGPPSIPDGRTGKNHAPQTSPETQNMATGGQITHARWTRQTHRHHSNDEQILKGSNTQKTPAGLRHLSHPYPQRPGICLKDFKQ